MTIDSSYLEVLFALKTPFAESLPRIFRRNSKPAYDNRKEETCGP